MCPICFLGHTVFDINCEYCVEYKNIVHDKKTILHHFNGNTKTIEFNDMEVEQYKKAVYNFNHFRNHGNIPDSDMEDQVKKYNTWATSIGQKTQYCIAAFLGEHLEDKLC